MSRPQNFFLNITWTPQIVHLCPKKQNDSRNRFKTKVSIEVRTEKIISSLSESQKLVYENLLWPKKVQQDPKSQ